MTLRKDSDSGNDKPSSPNPTVDYFDDLDFFKDFKNEFPAIVYNDAQTSKSDLLTEPILNPQHIDEFNLKDETSLSECDEEEQNVLNFNDLFPFNVIYPDELKTDTDNDNDKVDIEHSSGDLSVKPLPDVINTDVGAYAHGSNKLLEIMLAGRQPEMYFQFLSSLSSQTVYTTYPNPMDTAYSLSGCYPVFIFSTVYTTYSLNEYSVYRFQYDISWGMDTAYRLPIQSLGVYFESNQRIHEDRNCICFLRIYTGPQEKKIDKCW
ncbi:hypothetical protein Tco_0355599 [Tanacetum coccineum]